MKFGKRKLVDNTMLRAFVLTALIIMSSKTVFFGIMHMHQTMLATLVVLILAMIMSSNGLRIKRKPVEIMGIFVGLLIVVSAFYISDIVHSFNSYVGAILLFIEVFVIGMLYVNLTSKKAFVQTYVHLMFIIACISLFYFFWSMTDRSAALSGSNVYVNGSSSYMALPWYTFGWQTTMSNGYIYSYLFGRNAGPFWEPGAFQGFLFVGMFLLLQYRETFKHKTILLIVYLLTILTTQSTTAYLILLISLLGFGSDYVDCLFGKTGLKNRSKQVQYITYIGTIVFAIVIGYIILMSGNISNKFVADNGSLMDRTTDIRTALSVILYNPFAGIGLGSTGLSVANAQTVSATTLLAIAEYFGIPFMIYYAYRIFKGCLALYQPEGTMKKIALIISFFFILMSETLYLLPLYAVILFATELGGGNTSTP